jgi:hypothetical protein
MRESEKKVVGQILPEEDRALLPAGRAEEE